MFSEMHSDSQRADRILASIRREESRPGRGLLKIFFGMAPGVGKTYAMLEAAIPALEVISPGDAPHICAVTLPGYPSEVLVRVLGDQGICISSGSACHKGKPSHVFAAMSLPRPWLSGALRLSFAPDSTRDEADRLIAALTQASQSIFPTMS